MLNNCPLCSSRAVLLNAAHPGYKEPQNFKIWMCRNCDTQYADPMETDPGIYEMIYGDPSAIRGYSRYHDAAEFVLKSLNPLQRLAELEEPYWFVAEFLRGIPRSADILEIGCGLGYLTFAINRNGYHNARGMDISSNAVAKAKSRYGDLYFAEDLLQYALRTNDRFDVIMMTEIIEHLPNIIEFTGAAASLLKPTGALLVTTPNKSMHLPKAYWRTDNPPVHLWWLSETSMRFIAVKTRLTVEFYDWTPWHQRTVIGLPDGLNAVSPEPIMPPYIDHEGAIIPHPHHRATNVGVKTAARRVLGDSRYGLIKHAFKAPLASRNFYRRAARITAAHADTIGAIYTAA